VTVSAELLPEHYILRKEDNEESINLSDVTGMGIDESNGKEVIIVFVKHKVPESELEWSIVIKIRHFKKVLPLIIN
jgi:hypothetical protein